MTDPNCTIAMPNESYTSEQVTEACNMKQISENEKDLFLKAIAGTHLSENQEKWLMQIKRRMGLQKLKCFQCGSMVYGKISQNTNKAYWKCDNLNQHTTGQAIFIHPPKTTTAPISTSTVSTDHAKKRKFETE